MAVVKLSWYLCILFVIALAAESTITVAPSGEGGMRMLMGAMAALAVIFAAVAVTFRRLHVVEPRWLVRVFLGMAVMATVVVVVMVLG